MIHQIEVNKLNKIKSNFLNLLSNLTLDRLSYSPRPSGLYINDPTTPDLKLYGPLPSMGHLKFNVKGMNDSRSLNCFHVAANCISETQKFLPNPLKKWSATESLMIDPVAGADLNAYYDRKSIKLFYYNHNGRNTYFADSSDVVTHELGHALLDAMRPDFWSVQSLEIWSFHEAFSDIIAIFNLLNYDQVLEKVILETQGDLSKSNTASRLAEEIGILIRNITRDNSYLSNALRDPAVENFLYIDPKNLPKETKNNQLAAECHSFGRVFSNAWYNIFVRIFNLHISKGETQLNSLKKARDISFSSLLQAVPLSPRVSNYYEAIAKCMITTANILSSEYGKIVKDVFLEWNIISDSSFKTLSNKTWKDVIFNLNKKDIVFKNRSNTIVSVKNNVVFHISELPLLSNLSLKENFSVEVAYDSFYEFDYKGNLKDEISTNDQEIKNKTAQCILQISNLIGKGKMWEVNNGFLVRNFI